MWKVVVEQRPPACPQFGDGLVDVVDDEEGGGVLGARGWTLVKGEHGAGTCPVHHSASQIRIAWLR
jgi:hypothetical protein